MADNSTKAANMARILAIVHIIVGFLLFCFSIVDLVHLWTGYAYGCNGIWISVWMCIAGGPGIPGTRKERSTSRNACAAVFMGFSITSAVFGGIIIISYSMAIALYRDDYQYIYKSGGLCNGKFDTEMALSVIIFITGIVEFAIGIWTAVCLCIMKPWTCCYGNPPQQGQVMYAPNSGYATTQYPGGVPVTVPMQAGSGMVPIQTVTPGPQERQPQMVMVPVSGTMGNQPQFAQVATTGGMTTGFQPQFVQVAASGAMATVYQAQVPPKYEEGGYTKMGNDEMCIAGGLGIPGTRKEQSTSRNSFAGVFMGFSITSAVFGGTIIISYSRAIAFYRHDYRFVYERGYNDYDPTASYQYNYGFRRVRKDNFDTEMALSAIILILGIVEFAIGIWAAVCLCMMKACSCCYGNQQQGQVMYAPNSGYAMTQYPGGVPVTVPMQAGSGMVPIQTVTPGPQGGQPQMVMVPVSGTMGSQPQFAQNAASGAMTTGYQAQVPPKDEEGGYTKTGNDEFPVNTLDVPKIPVRVWYTP